MTTQTQQAVYEMLTENTGEHFLDSGGAYGRHWQRNQKKTHLDFMNEEELEVFNKDTEEPEIYKSLYHHLVDTAEYLPSLTKSLNKWIEEDKYSIDNPDGRSNNWHDVEQFMTEFVSDAKINCVYTYNEQNVLSQDIQFLYCGDIYENNIVAISIHNGCDARGGLTGYRFFKVDWDSFLNWDYEYYKYLVKEDNVA